MNPLQIRLAALRSRLRLVVSFRGCCWLGSFLLLIVVAAGWLDWRLHLPSWVRAAVVAGGLGGAGYLAYRFLLCPLWTRTDDLSLALQIEKRYPELNDALASTVQFLEDPDETEQRDSPSLRQAAVQQALRQSCACDFFQVIDRRGLRPACLALASLASLALVLTMLAPTLTRLALVRLANPFSSLEWPPQTTLKVQNYRPRVARGEAYEIHCLVAGVIPEQAIIDCEGVAPARQISAIRQDRSGQPEILVARWNQVEHAFRFRIRAHDADSGWLPVEVQLPPQLGLLNGRPSPQVRLRYPSYTDLPPQELPDGVGNLETVAGTHVTLRAATETPIVRAWIEQPEQPLTRVFAFLGPLLTPTGRHAALAAGLWPLLSDHQELGDRIPARLEPNGRVLSVEFFPRLSGVYALTLQDESGLSSTRRFDVRVLPDPAPTVNLERPASSRDNLTVLPGAEITVQVLTEDPMYALRSVALAYRCRDKQGLSKLLPSAQLMLYEQRALGVALPQLGMALAARFVPTPVPVLALRPQRLTLARSWSLEDLPLEEGDILTVQASADDFDDVTVLKQPGRSHEIEIRIIAAPALETLLNQEQAKVQQELLRLQKYQDEAAQKVIRPETHWRNTGKLRPEDVDHLLQAEVQQQHIRTRVGSKEEGLRAEVARILQTLRDNHMPRSGAHERMEQVDKELERLAQEELEQIEPRLANARKAHENAAEQQKPAKDEKGPLGEARDHQDEVARTLQELIKSLEPWSTMRELKGEAKSILQEQRRLHDETQDLSKKVPLGKPRIDLTQEEKADLETPAALQDKLAQRVADLLDKMERVARDKARLAEDKAAEAAALMRRAQAKQTPDPQATQALDEAAQALADPLQEKLRQAQASKPQGNETRQALDDLAKALKEGNADKVRDAEAKLRQARLKEPQEPKTAKALHELAQALQAPKPEQPRLTPDKLRLAEEKLRQARERPANSTETNQALQDAAEALQEALAQHEMAEPLQRAAKIGRANDARGQMKESKDKIKDNKISEATKAQHESVQKIQQLVKALEERREEDLDRLAKKMREAEQGMAKLIEAQDRLQKQVKEARGIADPKKREQELHRLQREQEQLQKRTQEMAQQLSRMKADRAAQALSRAGEQMEQAARQLERGENPEEQQEETLERLQDARHDLKQAKQDTEDELQREKLAKVADQIKQIKERQDALIAETARIQRELHGLSPGTGKPRLLRASLSGNARAQAGLGKETASLTEKLAGAEVFVRQLQKSAQAMERAAEDMAALVASTQRKTLDDATIHLQEDAQRRLALLLEALKPDKNAAKRRPSGDEPPGGEGGGQKSEGDGIPQLAQLKLLRNWQQDLNERTETFGKQHPDAKKLDEAKLKELKTMGLEQQELADLLDKLTTPSSSEGDKP